MTRRGLNGALGGAVIAGVPLHVTQTFFAVALVLGFLAGRDVARTTLLTVPSFRSLDEALHAFDSVRSASVSLSRSFVAGTSAPKPNTPSP